VRELPALDRAACRRDAEERFDTSRMTDNYVRLYEQLLASQHQPA
jgi:hypothetical protein